MSRVRFCSVNRAIPILFWAILFIISATEAILAGGAPRNVLVVKNRNSQTSIDIADYYVAARKIPRGNVCTIQCPTSESANEMEISSIVGAIRAFLAGNPEVASQIDYIVITKDIPLYLTTDQNTRISLTSILTCLGEVEVNAYLKNPYGPTAIPRVEKAFSHQLLLGGKYLYLVTRLDGYSKADIIKMIDRSKAASPSGSIALDQIVSPSPEYLTLNNRLQTANNMLSARAIPTIFDNTALFLGGLTNLIGYFSWGSNDYYFTNHYTEGLAAYRSNFFLPGSIGDTFVSTSGRTFMEPSQTGQTMIADLIKQGCCGVSGFVSEPYTINATYPDILFDRYTKGYNMAESFYMATPSLYWRSVVIGDPLMAAFATPPVVSINSPEVPLEGVTTISASASDAAGIAKVDFYFDGVYLGTSTQSPYCVSIDTTNYIVGAHNVEAIATETGSVATKGFATATMKIKNPISNLQKISDAFPSPDGQGIRATEKSVIAGTVDMGGTEFYIQEQNGTSGIRVISTKEVTEGAVVTVRGDLVTDSGEKSVRATSVELISNLLTPIKPVGVLNRSIGGGDITPETKGVTNGVGLRNIGKLVKTTGRVTYTGIETECFFYIDDGSALDDGSGHRGLKVICRNLQKPPLGSMVIITGISSCEQNGDVVARLLKLRKQSDISIIVL